MLHQYLKQKLFKCDFSKKSSPLCFTWAYSQEFQWCMLYIVQPGFGILLNKPVLNEFEKHVFGENKQKEKRNTIFNVSFELLTRNNLDEH